MKSSDYIYEILKEKIETMDSNGLFLLPLPTGSGKTYNVIKYIKENYKSKKIFFISNQLKLLPNLEDFQKGMTAEEKNDIAKHFLKLPSIYDSYKTFFEKYSEDECLVKYEDLRELDKIIKCYEQFDDSELKQYYYDKFSSKELEFRKKVKKYFNSNSSIASSDYEYLRTLYPAVEMDEKNIVIMSTKKFFLPIDKITSGIAYLPTEKIKDCVIFFDEFDAVKDELLDIIVKGNDYYKIDCIKLVRKIFSNAYNLSGSLIFDDVINYPIETDTYIKKGNDIIGKLKKYMDEYYDLYYRIKYPFLKKEHEEKKTFIFKDIRSVLVSSDKENKQLKFESNEENVTNYIVKEAKQLSFEPNTIRRVIDESIYLLKNFMYNVLKLARLCYEYNFKVKKDNNTNLIDSINSIIDRMDFGQEYKSFLVKEIFNLTKTRELESSEYEIEDKRDRRRRKYDFYYDGFSFVQLVDIDNEFYETKIYFNMFNLTPEAMMLKVASIHKVVGISATATFNTCIKNFDINFLKYKLEKHFTELEYEQYEMFKELYEQEQLDYAILIEKTPSNDKSLKEEVLKIIVDKEEFKKEIESLPIFYKEKLKDIFNILIEYERFMNRVNHHSFIFFLSYNLNNFCDIKAFVFKWVKRLKSFDTDTYLEIIDKSIIKDSDFDTKMTNHKKVFLISCYQTIGVGINLNYPIPNSDIFSEDNLIIGNSEKMEKDIDGCYLSKVTNVIPFAKRGIELEDELLAKVLYYLEYLKANDEISYFMFNKALNGLFNNSGTYIGKFHSYKDICIGATRVLVQAIGRICRTHNKNKQVYISYEQDNENFIRDIKEYLSKFTFNKEFQSFLDKISPHRANLIKEVTYSNIESYKETKRLLGWPWDEYRMKEWLRLRNFVLKHPTANGSDFINNMDLKKYYFKMSERLSGYSVDKYNYTKNIDFNASRNSNGLLEKRLYVSAEDCKLTHLMRNEYFKNYFIVRGYATDFEENTYIMCPLLYHSIYKGALGEVIGKACFDKYGIVANQINDFKTFELFDYYNGQIYYDFKKWDSSFKISEDEQLNKINTKMEYGNITRAYIINVLFEGYYDKELEGLLYNYDNKKIVTVSWLYDVYTGKFNEAALIDIKNSK